MKIKDRWWQSELSFKLNASLIILVSLAPLSLKNFDRPSGGGGSRCVLWREGIVSMWARKSVGV